MRSLTMHTDTWESFYSEMRELDKIKQNRGDTKVQSLYLFKSSENIHN
jgi:hypothetical protein